MHDGENTLFHLAGILSTKNNHLHPLEIDLDTCRRAHTLGEAISRELASIVDDEIGDAEIGKLLSGRTYEHIVHEQGMVGTSADDPDLDAVLGIPACKAVKDIDHVACIEIVNGTFAVDFESVWWIVTRVSM